VNLGSFSPGIAPLLVANEQESVLDVGCGTGYYSALVPGLYVGIDPDADRIRYASLIRGGSRRTFLATRVQQLAADYPAKHFDKAMVVNVLHHLNDSECIDLLASLSTLVKGTIVLTDADRDANRGVQAVLLNSDPGSHMRSSAELVELVSRVLKVDEIGQFTARSKSVVLVTLGCRPKE
jgi:SAM-dependent methyltransferase